MVLREKFKFLILPKNEKGFLKSPAPEKKILTLSLKKKTTILAKLMLIKNALPNFGTLLGFFV